MVWSSEVADLDVVVCTLVLCKLMVLYFCVLHCVVGVGLEVKLVWTLCQNRFGGTGCSLKIVFFICLFLDLSNVWGGNTGTR